MGDSAPQSILRNARQAAKDQKEVVRIVEEKGQRSE